MKNSILRVLKKKMRRALEWVKLQKESACDAHRYFRAASWAGPGRKHELAHLESELIKHYHVLEKGLVMPDFRPRSGKAVLKQLIVLVKTWGRAGGSENAFHFLAALEAINSYEKKHQEIGVDVSDLISGGLPCVGLQFESEAGAKKPREISAESLAHFDEIALSRHSVRQFSPDRMPPRELLESAVGVAISAPSVCNRQTWRIHFYSGETAQKILSFQNGNRGFGHLIPIVAVITSDLRLFAGGVERYQGWIEGGLFSMNFLLALHARGISSVPLNWSRTNHDDCRFRKAADIPEYERVIMLIGCGYAAGDQEVTCSPRSPISYFSKWH